MSTQAQKANFTFHFVGPSETIALGVVLPFACAVATFVRFLTRRNQIGGTGLDDWLILFALFNVVGMGLSLVVGAAIHAVGYPTPRPPPDLTRQQIFQYVPQSVVITDKIQYIFQIMMILAYGSIKVSITLFYRRVFVASKGSFFDIATKITLCVLGLWTLAFELVMIFDCGIHISANWGNYVQQISYCQVLGFASEYGMAVSDLILDVIVVLMPLPLVWKLKLTIPQKLSVTGVLLLGATSIGASIARLVLYLQLLSASAKGIVADVDLETTVSMYWSLLEAGLALIAACLPIIWVGQRAKRVKPEDCCGSDSETGGKGSLALSANSSASVSERDLEAKGGVVGVSVSVSEEKEVWDELDGGVAMARRRLEGDY